MELNSTYRTNFSLESGSNSFWITEISEQVTVIYSIFWGLTKMQEISYHILNCTTISISCFNIYDICDMKCFTITISASEKAETKYLGRRSINILISEIMCICHFMCLIYMATQGLVSEIALMATTTTRLIINPKHHLFIYALIFHIASVSNWSSTSISV